MDKFTKEELTAMGFEKTYVSRKESGDIAYDYYTFGRPHIDLISNCFEKGVDEVTVELFDMDGKALSREFINACVKEFGDGKDK